MPVTYNGVGTRYVGRTNVDARPAVCPHCHRAATLTSYDTRLWFVVLFIPVIPLARKRIISQCSSCSRHYVMPLDQWEAGKQLNISGAMDEYRRDPSPEKAVAAHSQLIAYHQSAQAQEFAQTLASQYPDNANVLLYLGKASEHFGQAGKAAEYFTRALALRPDLPELRIAAADNLRRQGKLDEARALLDFLVEPGAARLHSAAPLELLANAYQAAKRHEDALALYQVVLREVPQAAQHTGFRKRMRQSEKALKRAASGLPPRRFTFGSLFGPEAGNLRLLTIGGVALALAAAAMVASNVYIRGHRTLYAVNNYDQPATVTLPGFPPLTVPPHGRAEMALPEGNYHARVAGPVTEEVDCYLIADYFDRFFSSPAWVLNVGGDAVLFVARVHYVAGGGVPSDLYFFTGDRFHFFTQIDYPFAEPPERMTLDKGQTSKAVDQLDYFRASAAAVVRQFSLEKRYPEALTLGETRLKSRPDEPGLVDVYAGAARAGDQLPRARNFLAAGLGRRPVDIAWHRLYQGIEHRTAGGPERLLETYTRLLAAEPGSSALLYLRGRVCEDRAEAAGYFERAAAEDPKNPWPLFAQGYSRAQTGDWAGARALLVKAVDLAPDDDEIGELLFMTRLARGEGAALEAEQRQVLEKQPGSVLATRRLCDVLDAAGRTLDSHEVVEEWADKIGRRNKGEAMAAVIAHLRRYAFYSEGDFAALEQSVRTGKTAEDRAELAQALIEEGKLEEAGRVLDRLPPDDQSASRLLAVSVAGAARGDAARARDYRARAVDALRKQGIPGAAPATLLSQAAAPTTAQIDAPDIELNLKRLLLVALAQEHPERAAEYKRQAAALNVVRTFPFQLVDKVSHGRPL